VDLWDVSVETFPMPAEERVEAVKGRTALLAAIRRATLAMKAA
jgi:hypothetical protein